ncbi:hypothetical protein JB92DRAFT_3098940 [Gautieria morchelliformis]|nr:hypothetical protein JB92DRAFT_3098940 [Gautieria morchelliformis]
MALTLPMNKIFGPTPTRRLLAVVQNCLTDGEDVTLGPVTYTECGPRHMSSNFQQSVVSSAGYRLGLGTTTTISDARTGLGLGSALAGSGSTKPQAQPNSQARAGSAWPRLKPGLHL